MVEARVVVFLADVARDGVFLAFTGFTSTAPSAPFEATAFFLLVEVLVVRFLTVEPVSVAPGSAADAGEAVFRRDERTEEVPFCRGFSSAAR